MHELTCPASARVRYCIANVTHGVPHEDFNHSLYSRRAELRADAERVLEHGETLSAFVELSLRAQIERRQAQRQFIERGLASREEALASEKYHTADEVLKELDGMLAAAEAKVKPLHIECDIRAPHARMFGVCMRTCLKRT